MRPRLSLVTLGVRDFERSLQFYREGLGWKPSSASQDDVAFFQLSGVVLALYPREKLAEDAQVSPLRVPIPKPCYRLKSYFYAGNRLALPRQPQRRR